MRAIGCTTPNCAHLVEARAFDDAAHAEPG